MPNCYNQATLSPDSIHLSTMHQAWLKMTGASCEKEDDGRFYVCWCEALNEDVGDFQIVDALQAGTITEGEADFIGKHSFNEMLRHVLCYNGKVSHITVEGAWTCEKMQPGLFGGAICVVSRTEHLDLSTGSARFNEKTGKIEVDYEVRQFNDAP
jgi:hypothetical protein